MTMDPTDGAITEWRAAATVAGEAEKAWRAWQAEWSPLATEPLGAIEHVRRETRPEVLIEGMRLREVAHDAWRAFQAHGWPPTA